LVLLSDVAGLYDGDPSEPCRQVLPTVTRIDKSVFALVRDKATGLSKGGMASKLTAARIATAAGGNVIIAPGREPNVLPRLLAGEPVGTLFLAQGDILAARKRWIGFSVQPRGRLTVDAGARVAIQHHGRSLLPIGVVDVEGRFGKGDVVALVDPAGEEFARGLTNYTAEEVRAIKGLRSNHIPAMLGYCPYQEIIHRDNMVVTLPAGPA
jgi:glutamate 5-kinase